MEKILKIPQTKNCGRCGHSFDHEIDARIISRGLCSFGPTTVKCSECQYKHYFPRVDSARCEFVEPRRNPEEQQQRHGTFAWITRKLKKRQKEQRQTCLWRAFAPPFD
jgi:hypothetical protein